jgi:hypothetical protein
VVVMLLSPSPPYDLTTKRQRVALASATSRTPALPPVLEIGYDLVFGEAPLFHLAPHLIAENRKHFALQFNGHGTLRADLHVVTLVTIALPRN